MIEYTAASDLAVRAPKFQLSAWRIMVALAMAGITLSWLAPFYHALLQTGLGVDLLPILIGLSVIMSLAYLADMLVEYLRIRSNVRIHIQLTVLIISGLLGLYLMVWNTPGYGTSRVSDFIVMPEVIGISTVLIAWWRGQTLFQHQIGTFKIRKAFRQGIWLHLLTGLLRVQISGHFDPLPFYLFLFAGLVGLGSARLSTVGSLRGGSGVPFDRSLIAGLGGSAVGLILVSSMVAIMAKGPLASLIRRFLGGAVSVLAEAVFFVLRPVIRFIFNLMGSLFGVDGGMLLDEEALNPDTFGDVIHQTMVELDEEIIPPTWAADLGQIVKFSLIAVGLIILILLIYAGLQQWRARSKFSIRDDRESLITLADLPRMLQQALRERFRRVIDRFQRLRPDERRYAAARIRRIYAELMDLSQRLDMERPKALTPLEFLPSLKMLFESEDDALEHITRAYLKVRYGELPETRQQVDEIESAWQKIEARGKFLFREAHGRLGIG